MSAQQAPSAAVDSFHAMTVGMAFEAVASNPPLCERPARPERLDPESLDSLARSTRELCLASARMATERFDELVGEPGEAIAIRARQLDGRPIFEIRKATEAADLADWLVLPPAASTEDVERWTADMESTLGGSPLARLRHERAQEARRREAEAAGLGDSFVPEIFQGDAGPRAEQHRANARFVLARTWLMDHEEELVEHVFKAVHGMDFRAAARMAAEAERVRSEQRARAHRQPIQDLGRDALGFAARPARRAVGMSL